MADQNHDDVAKALAALASGHHPENDAPSESAPPAPLPPARPPTPARAPAPARPPARPAPPSRPAAPPGSAAPSRPAAPLSSVPINPPAAPNIASPKKSVRPPAPGQPLPQIQPSSAPPPRQRSAAPASSASPPPNIPPAELGDEPQLLEDSQPIEAVDFSQSQTASLPPAPSRRPAGPPRRASPTPAQPSLPAQPEMQSFAAAPRAGRRRLSKSLYYRQTITPVLLTLGVLLPGVTYMLKTGSKTYQVQLLTPAMRLGLIAGGIACLALGLLNAMLLKIALKNQSQNNRR